MSTTLKEKPTTTASQKIEIRPVAGRIGAEIGNVRLGGDLDPQTFIDIRQALLKHRVIFFRGQQHLDDAEQALVTGASGQNPVARGLPSNAALAILLGGGEDKVDDGYNTLLAIRQRQVKEYVQRVRVAGFVAWVLWIFIHILYLAGFRNRLSVLIQWAYAYFTWQRGVRLNARSTT